MVKPKVIIIGGGFGGLNAAKSLAKLDVDLTLIDRNNYHCFQPLLYQVATAALSAVDIAYPIRRVLKGHKNIEVLMAEVKKVDAKGQKIFSDQGEIPYDYLILAPGSHYNYFGKDDWSGRAPSLKTIRDALKIRRLVLTAFEKAEMEEDPERRKAHLHFVVVGGGPTGVELSGSIAELAHHTLTDDFRRINTASAQILLVEAGPRILGPFPERLADQARERLKKMGVRVLEKTRVEDVTSEGVALNSEFLPAKTVLWCAGVLASPLLKTLGVPLDRGGRASVREDLSLEAYPNVFVIGDAAQFKSGEIILPGLAPVAIQQGRHLKKVLESRFRGEARAPAFRYFDKGAMATVGKGFALAEFKGIQTAGFWGWLLWCFVHILYLIGFRNRALVFFSWAIQYFSYDRGARIINAEGDENPSRTPS